MSNLKNEMDSARDTSSVKQAEIMQVISSPKKYIFFVEGKDDIPCYRSWFGKIDEIFLKNTELINLNQKDKVLETFWDYIGKDRKSITDKIYAIIDHDFDGYKEYESHEHIYLNHEIYAIENQICSEAVLEEVLKSKFLCNDINAISNIKETYRKYLNVFTSETEDINKKIFIAKRLGKTIKINPISIEIGNDCNINIKNKDTLLECEDIILGEAQANKLDSDFVILNKETQYRGKFLFEFFKKWFIFLGKNSGIPPVKICNFNDGDEYMGTVLTKEDKEHKKIIDEKKVIDNMNQWRIEDYCSLSFPASSLRDFVKKITKS